MISKILNSKESIGYFEKQIDLHIFYCENELIVDNEIIQKMVKKLGIPDKLYFLKTFFHDFLDYENEEADRFYEKLNDIIKS